MGEWSWEQDEHGSGTGMGAGMGGARKQDGHGSATGMGQVDIVSIGPVKSTYSSSDTDSALGLSRQQASDVCCWFLGGGTGVSYKLEDVDWCLATP